MFAVYIKQTEKIYNVLFIHNILQTRLNFNSYTTICSKISCTKNISSTHMYVYKCMIKILLAKQCCYNFIVQLMEILLGEKNSPNYNNLIC